MQWVDLQSCGYHQSFGLDGGFIRATGWHQYSEDYSEGNIVPNFIQVFLPAHSNNNFLFWTPLQKNSIPCRILWGIAMNSDSKRTNIKLIVT